MEEKLRKPAYLCLKGENGMQANLPIPNYLIDLVEQLRARIKDPAFQERHRVKPTDFTRERKLPFERVCLLMLQKTSKSIARHLAEFDHRIYLLLQLPAKETTAGAWTQARAKFKPGALVELNQKVLLPIAYGQEHHPSLRFWHGLRVLGLDSSTVNIPVSPGIEEHFRVFVPGS